MEHVRITPARSVEQLDSARRLFTAYQRFLGFSLCFQGFDEELLTLPGKYAAPMGELWLAQDAAGVAVGCVAVRPLADGGACEMKRLWVDPAVQASGIGRRLAVQAVKFAQFSGYKKVRLDTLHRLVAAIHLYRSLGFVEIPPYTANPNPDVLYMELTW
jgi:putative acetyltransferase